MTALDQRELEAANKRAIAAIHWVFSADGTKAERSMADEAINKINDPTFMPIASLPPAPAGSVGEETLWREMVQAHASAMRMVIDAIEHLFGPAANMESEDASLLRGPEPHHRAEGVIEALQRIATALSAVPAPPVQEPVAFDVERFLQDDSGLPPFASPSPLSAQEDGWQPIETANKVVDETVLLRIEHPHYAIAPPEDRHLWETITTAHWTDFNKGGWVWYGLAGSPTHWRHLPAPPQPQEMKP